ncbi:antitoxin PaaA2 family protein [Commensalibacter nepenthis]|uniref:Stability determinant domain-containing protein n=1 Tax=Commensalibacter nepenthis TaxID=3043872 RepID=A0ABT6Q4G8_9PROT|nr:hypothetical protein [Commensalibacter sp. TBRC 10068]MDI2111778.1 hypothetical protein [Commensalibacter sp. TBRC 10068]
MTTETINHSTLSKLVEAGTVSGAHVVGQNGGWSVFIQFGKIKKQLITKNNHDIRLFKKLETLVSYLRNIGIVKFDVDALAYDSNIVTSTKRPDRSEALRKAHEAAAYDKWFREEVQASIDDPRSSLSNEEVKKYATTRHARLLERIK